MKKFTCANITKPRQVRIYDREAGGVCIEVTDGDYFQVIAVLTDDGELKLPKLNSETARTLGLSLGLDHTIKLTFG